MKYFALAMLVIILAIGAYVLQSIGDDLSSVALPETLKTDDKISSVPNHILLPAVISGAGLAKLLEQPQHIIQLVDAAQSGEKLGPWPTTQLRWTDFVDESAASKGILLDQQTLMKKLATLSLDPSLPTVVYGDPKNDWGEAGRILWMLDIAGFKNFSYLDGGVRALTKKTGTTNKTVGVRERQLFDPRFGAKELRQLQGKIDLLDAREPREFAGATPYGSERGGHISGAKNYWFRRVLDADGFLRSPSEIKKELAAMDISGERPIVTYCTGGVRSAFLEYVLRHHVGLPQTYNYDGSWWQWSKTRN